MLKNWTKSSLISTLGYKGKFGDYVTNINSTDNILNYPHLAFLGADESSDLIRKELFKLAFPFQNCKILDFGNLLDQSPEENIAFFSYLLTSNIIPIYIASDPNQSEHVFQSVLNLNIPSSWAVVHPSLADDMNLRPLLDNGVEEGLVKARFLGHQSHVTPVEELAKLQASGVESMRLGHIRQNIDRVEPWCRSIDHGLFHMDAMRSTDFPAQKSSNPGGFFYEEACKICQFIGASSHLKSIGFYGYQPEKDKDGLSAAVLAQMIWYFIDGFHHFRETQSIQKSKLTQYVVHAAHSDLDINFWKNPETGRWWMEVPGVQDHWVSCTYDDYLEACHGSFSSRLINVLNRN